MKEKYATSSIYKYMDDRWRAQFPYFEDGAWHKKTRLLEHRAAIKVVAISIETRPWWKLRSFAPA